MAKKPRIRASVYEQSLRRYAENISERAENDWHWGNLYINALKAAEVCRQFDCTRHDRLNGNDTSDYNGERVLAALGYAIEKRREEKDADNGTDTTDTE